MKTEKNTKIIEKIEKEEGFLDRHTLNWFIDSETNELKIGKSISDFFNKKTENFSIKKIHLCDVKYWRLAETTDGKFVLLSRTKILK
jgi:hypothetical protein